MVSSENGLRADGGYFSGRLACTYLRGTSFGLGEFDFIIKSDRWFLVKGGARDLGLCASTRGAGVLLGRHIELAIEGEMRSLGDLPA